MPLPTDTPNWANAAAADDVATPPDASRAAGWPFGLPPPHEWVNWFWQLTSQWLTHIAGGGHPGTQDWLDEAYDAVDDGELVWVWRPNAGAGGSVYEATNPSADLVDADTDGVHLLYATAATAYLRPRRGGSNLATYNPSDSGTLRSVATDGQTVALAYGDHVEAYDMDGTSRWSVDTGAAVHDVAVYEGNVYACGVNGARALATDDGTEEWVYDHGGTLYALAAGADRVFVAGDASGHASGATLRAIRSFNGADAAGEGGTSTDTQGLAWDQVQTTPQSEPHTLATDGLRLICGYPVAATNELEVRSAGDGSISVSRSLGEGVHAVAADQGLLLAGVETSGGDGYTLGLDRSNLGTLWRTITHSGSVPTAVCSDGQDVFYTTSGGTERLHWCSRGPNSPTLFLRVDYADATYGVGGLPMTGAIIPAGTLE